MGGKTKTYIYINKYYNFPKQKNKKSRQAVNFLTNHLIIQFMFVTGHYSLSTNGSVMWMVNPTLTSDFSNWNKYDLCCFWGVCRFVWIFFLLVFFLFFSFFFFFLFFFSFFLFFCVATVSVYAGQRCHHCVAIADKLRPNCRYCWYCRSWLWRCWPVCGCRGHQETKSGTKDKERGCR